MSGSGDDSKRRPATRLVRGGRRREWTGPVVNPPVWRGSTHLYATDAERQAAGGNNADGQFFYGRRGAPTQWALAEALTQIEPGAVCDLNTALQLACARAAAGQAAGTAQALAAVDRIGPHQARSLTGRLQLPLSAIAPLRQGQTPLFVPLVHVTLEGENLPAQVRTFVIGTPSASGRVHPIPLDVPPGGIAGLIAQIVAVPPASQAA